MQSSGTRCPLIEAAPQRPCSAAVGAAAAAPFASGTVSPGIAGTVMPPIVTQPLAGAEGAAGALPEAAAFATGTVKPGIAGKTRPPKFTQPAGADTVASEVTRVGGGKDGVGGAAVIAAGSGGESGSPQPALGARALS